MDDVKNSVKESNRISKLVNPSQSTHVSLSAVNAQDCKTGELMLDEEEVSSVTARIVEDLKGGPQLGFRAAKISVWSPNAKAGSARTASRCSEADKKLNATLPGVAKRSFGTTSPSSTSPAVISVPSDSEPWQKVARRRTGKGPALLALQPPPPLSPSLRPADLVVGAVVPAYTGPELGKLNPAQFQVIEVESETEKNAAYELHLSKNTFHEERTMVEFRIFKGDDCGCRTWVLLQPREAPSGAVASTNNGSNSSRGPTKYTGHGRAGGFASLSSPTATYLAATTVRINPYQKRPGRWAQVLNMSTRRERLGFGTYLIAGMQELLRQENIDVVVLYPAENGRATEFWSSIGWKTRGKSLLPDEELIPHDEGGPLLPEFDPGTHGALPRWEKRLIDEGIVASEFSTGPNLRGGRGRKEVVNTDRTTRSMPPSGSRVKGEKLTGAVEELRRERQRWKIEHMSTAPQVI